MVIVSVGLNTSSLYTNCSSPEEKSKSNSSVNSPPSRSSTPFPSFPLPPESLTFKVKSPDVVAKVVSDNARMIVDLLIAKGAPSY